MRTETLLGEIATALGRPARDPWLTALTSTPRTAFLPDTIWIRDGDGGYLMLDRTSDTEAWNAAAASDQPLVTEFTVLGDERVPLSSASAPSTVVRLLEEAGPGPGSRVLEIGTGTGFNTALLCSVVGAGSVVTLDNVAEFSVLAGQSLRALGHRPTVVTADGTEGWPDRAPYSHVLATCSVRAVPSAWLEQTEPGGRIVTPWDSPWACYGTLALDRLADGSARGRFAGHGSYMLISSQRVAADLADSVEPGHTPTLGTTALSPWEVAGADLDAHFHIGLAVAGAWHSWDTSGEDSPVRLWIADTDGPSWASVDWDGAQSAEFTVRQYGPRRLWDEVTAAYGWWWAQGRPAVDRYGMTVGADGRHTSWLDSPDLAVPRTGRV
ncbi:methyltransferase [Streptomyces sp. NPDC002039]|uniref:methyltransferase n=1 Tax=Streptomyces sp. NPDC002039 TaxID=3154660 RepID=UPI00332FD53C